MASARTRQTRADALRERRRRETNKKEEKNSARYQQMSKPMNVPIIVRGGSIGTPVVHRTRTKVRRKFSVPINKSGAEMSIPGLPIFHPGWRLLSGAIVIVLSIFILLINISSAFKVNQFQVTGLQRLNVADLANVLRLDKIPIFLVNPAKTKAILAEAFPALREIQVRVVPPSDVMISVVERQPVISWEYEGLVLWIDEDGYVYPQHGDSSGLFPVYAQKGPPTLSQPVSEAATDKGIVLAAATTGAQLTKGRVDPAFIQSVLELKEKMPAVTSLSYKEKDGYGWHDDENNWNVYFGYELDHLDQKILVYNAIVAMLTDKGIHPRMISVANLSAPYYRLEQ
jgi:hypothetical protein